MGLVYPGQTVKTLSGHSIRANDAVSGERVAVKASDEAMQDNGLASVQQVAERKYDDGDLEPDGSVYVRIGDFGSVGSP